MQIEITTNHPASSYGIPVCLIDGQPQDDAAGLRACMELLSWSRAQTGEQTGKSLSSLDAYLYGGKPVPAEVWNVMRDAIHQHH